MLNGSQNTQNNHEVIKGCYKPISKEHNEKGSLNVAANFKGIQVEAGEAPELNQRKDNGRDQKEKPQSKTQKVG